MGEKREGMGGPADFQIGHSISDERLDLETVRTDPTPEVLLLAEAHIIYEQEGQ